MFDCITERLFIVVREIVSEDKATMTLPECACTLHDTAMGYAGWAAARYAAANPGYTVAQHRLGFSVRCGKVGVDFRVTTIMFVR